jgi:capsid portal protein
MLIETESLDTGFDGNPATVQLVPLANILQKDELFQDYTENTRKRVQSAFNLPDLYVGYTQDFNRATAQTAIEVTEKQVFQPERASLAWIINNKLLNGYNLQYCEVEFDGPDLTNPDDIFKLLSVAERAGGVTPNMAKAIANDALGQESEDYEGDWGNVPVVISNAQATQQMLTGAPSQESAQKTENEEETDKAKTPDIDPSVKDKLDGQIEKAEQENADDAVIAVMKQVRSLLVEIRKQAGEEA